MNYEEINVLPRDLPSQWRSFGQFWTEYAATIAPLEPQQWWEQPTVVSPDLEALLLSARATAELPSNETLTQALKAELLQLLSRVVHPRDLEVLRQYFDWGDFVDLALWLYGWRGSDPRAELYPTVPQPCYGSPLNAKVFTIFNNPGADPRIEARDDSLVWKEFVADQKGTLNVNKIWKGREWSSLCCPGPQSSAWWEKKVSPNTAMSAISILAMALRTPSWAKYMESKRFSTWISWHTNQRIERLNLLTRFLR